MAALTGLRNRIAVCEVATECCVLSTILGAVDHGRFVRLVSDACAAGSPQGDAQALGIHAPMVRVATRMRSSIAEGVSRRATGR